MPMSMRSPKPAASRWCAALLLCTVGATLAGCFATGPARQAAPATTYPEVVADFGRYDRFPQEVAGYTRRQALTYAPGMVTYSIAYERDDAVVDSAVGLFFYPRMNDTAAQLRSEEQEVLQRHRATRVVSSKTIRLIRNGAPFEAHVTNFEYDEVFRGTLQPVASQLLVVFRAQGVFKVRSTAPRAQAAVAEGAMLKLLDGVAWDAPEAFIGH